MRHSLRAAGGGFTLIELLMVIAIIALLAGMLFPVTSQVIDRARATKCLGNLRQIGMAALSAANDNDNRFPIIEMDSKNPIHDPEDNALPLPEALKRYGITEAVHQCPADLKAANWFSQTGSSYMWQPYAEDEPQGAISIYGRRGQVLAKPSRVRLATDYEPVHPAEATGGRKRSNTLYADGHVTLR